MSNINYLSILKKSWQITWHNKYLWWFGFLISLAGSGEFLNFDFRDLPNMEGARINLEVKRRALEFFANYSNWIIIGTAVLAVILLVLLVLEIIARGGLISAIGNISNPKQAGEISNFKKSFKEGRKYFWKIFAIGFATGVFGMALAAVLFIPVVFLFLNHSYILGGLLLAAAIIILLPIYILISYLRTYGYIYAVLSGLAFWPAIENGYVLFRKNLPASIVMGLMLALAGIILGIAIVLALIPITVVFLIVGAGLYAIFKTVGIVIAGIVFVGAAFAAMLFGQSVFQVFRQAAWVLFFREIAAPKEEEKIAEVVPEAKAIPDATPDPATFSEE